MFRILFLFLVAPLALQAQLPGNSLRLKANGNFVTVADASSVSLNDTMSMEMWLYFRCDNGQSTHLMTKGWCGNGDWSYYWNIYDNKLRFARWHQTFTGGCNGNHALFETADSIPYNTWTHVAVTIRDQDVKMYINGIDAGTTLISGQNGDGFNPCSQPIRIGNYLNASSQNVGTPRCNMDEIRIWHKELTASEILSNMNQELAGNEAGLVAYYKLNESGSGAGIPVLNSASGSALPNGTTTGNATNIYFEASTGIIDDLPTCDPVVWLRADTGVSKTVTNAVTQWNDLSGFNHHVTQNNSIYQPRYDTNVINRKPAIYFDGAGGKSFLNNTTANPVLSGSARTVFVAARRDCKTHPGGLIGGTLFTFRRSGLIHTLSYGANSAGTPVYIYSDNNGIGNNNASINAANLDTSLRNTLLTYRAPAAGGQMQFKLNQVTESVNQGTGSITAETGADGFTVGDREDQPDLDWNGWIYEIIVFNRSLSNREVTQVEKYLAQKYPKTPTVFNAVYTNLQNYSTHGMDDGTWIHSYNSNDLTKVIASVKSACLDLGIRSDTVYVEPTAINIGSTFAMRRHFTIQTSLQPVGTKRVRLYYTQADFADLQSHVPGLTAHSQLCVTKYDGSGEDGYFDASGGSLTFIPASSITTGTAFGQRFLEFDVNDFSEFWIHALGNSPLPLSALQFQVTACGEAACLSWKTRNEQNILAHYPERSQDGKQFNTLQTLNALNGEEQMYQYTDGSPRANNYYRIRSEDQDGRIRYSAVQRLQFTTKNSANIYPNPSYGTCTLSGLQNYNTLMVYDLSGRLVYTHPIAQDHLELNTSAWTRGSYFIKLVGEQEPQSLRLEVE